MGHLYIDGEHLTIKDVINVAREGFKVELSPEAVSKIKKSREYVDDLVEKEAVVYGITT
ncbi:MAG: aromatic amino acid lyase, partial [Lutispora sp.]